MEDGGILMVSAGNSSDVTGGCFVLVVGFGGVKIICGCRQLVFVKSKLKAPSLTLHENSSREIMRESGSFAKPGNG